MKKVQILAAMAAVMFLAACGGGPSDAPVQPTLKTACELAGGLCISNGQSNDLCFHTREEAPVGQYSCTLGPSNRTNQFNGVCCVPY